MEVFFSLNNNFNVDFNNFNVDLVILSIYSSPKMLSDKSYVNQDFFDYRKTINTKLYEFEVYGC